MKAMKIILLLMVVSLAGCPPIPIPTPFPTPSLFSVVVNNSSGAPVAGAEVFQNGELKGSTDGTGKLVFSSKAPIGAQIFARQLVYTQPSYRPGTTGGWVMHVYQTSRVVNNDGSVTDLTVTNPNVTQTLTVRPDNTLIGWHLIATLDWDASTDEFNELKIRFTEASEYLYNLTDGQFVIEEVEIADDGQLHVSAEIAFKVDNFVWPHTTYPGGFLFAVGGLPHISMAPFGDQGGTQGHRTLVHELGHLAFGLADEYAGVNINPGGPVNYCTAVRHLGTGAPSEFTNSGARAACAMHDEYQSNKLCSAHPDSLHRTGNWQPGPCWHTVAAAYGDPGPGAQFGTGVIFQDRWIVKTPDKRGAVVGKLPPLPVGLRPKIDVSKNKTYSDLCKPMTLVDPNGAAAANATVWVRPRFWRNFDFTVGRLDSNGKLVARGVHAGDTIRSPFSTLTAPCIITY
jgi:hypothetical protein